MQQLYFIRHGETEWNRENRLQGRLDSPLTDNGILQAGMLAERLANETFTSIISSTSGRAVQTAKLLMGNRDIPYFTDERLMEIDLADWQGKTLSEIKEFDSFRYDCYYHIPRLFTNDRGETFVDVKQRLEDFLIDVEERFPSGKLLVVTHGVVIKVLLHLICKNLPLESIWDPPHIRGTSITIINSHKGKKEILKEGTISHLSTAK